MTEAWAQMAWEVLAAEGRVPLPPAEDRNLAALEAAMATGAVEREGLLAGLAQHYDFALAETLPSRFEPDWRQRLDPEWARERQVLPIREVGDVLHVAVADPLDWETLEDLSARLEGRVEPCLTDPWTLAEAVKRYGEGREPSAEEAADAPSGREAEPACEGEGGRGAARGGGVEGEREEPGAPVVRLVEQLLGEAIRRGASDLHLEPQAGRLRLRFRIDGRLREMRAPPANLHAALVARLKLISGMSVGEKRRPQDGRLRFVAEGSELDLRVSCLPSHFGETMVLRILDRAGMHRGLADLGMRSEDEDRFQAIVQRPDGMILVTGPTGSGKTTTLYAALNHLNGPQRKIITVEDPVEYRLTGVNQVAVRRELGLDFATALRAILRQAPNVIMVGEIRDRETAEMAMNASLTGHLVFSTLHTNDAVAAVTRMADLGTKRFLLAHALRAVVAQRLVRMICPTCRSVVPATGPERALLGLGAPGDAPLELAFGRGCEHCGGSGFRGRRGLFEFFIPDEGLRQRIHSGADGAEMRRQARAGGMRTLREDGVAKVLAGWTTLAEVLAVTGEEMRQPVEAET